MRFRLLKNVVLFVPPRSTFIRLNGEVSEPGGAVVARQRVYNSWIAEGEKGL